MHGADMLRLGAVSGGHRTFHAPRDDGVLLELNDVVVSYARGALTLRQHAALPAVGGVSLSVKVRESVGLVGESGSGKTSLGRSIMRLAPLTSGQISVVEPDTGDSGDPIGTHRPEAGPLGADHFPGSRTPASIPATAWKGSSARRCGSTGWAIGPSAPM